MVYNSPGYAFGALLSQIKEPTIAYSSLTTAQCAANGAFTSKAVTSSGVLVEAAKSRSKGLSLIVPIDQPAVTFGNLSTVVALPNGPVTPANQTGAPVAGYGFQIPPGGSVSLDPFNDAVYAVTPTGVTATIYFLDH